jgi:hypothetical protein
VRNLSLPALQAIFTQDTGEVFLMCLTIDGPGLAAPIRLVDDQQDLVRTAGTFQAFPFQIAMPQESEDQLPQVQLVVDNVDRQIVQAIRALTSPPTVTLEVVLASSPNTLEAGPFAMTLRHSDYDATAVSGTLGYEDMLNEPFPKDSFTPTNSPGLFT